MANKFTFGQPVIVEGNLVGCVVKMWEDGSCEVYVRYYNTTRHYQECDIKNYVFDKVVDGD